MNKSTLIIVAGYPGSGKTELAKYLASSCAWPLLDKDTLTRELVEAYAALVCEDPHDRHSDHYRDLIRPLEYIILRNTTDEIIAMGASLVVSAPFTIELQDLSFLNYLEDKGDFDGVDVRCVWVKCDLSMMRQRLANRGADRDSWKLANWDSYAATVNSDFIPRREFEAVDNSTDGIQALAHTARRLLQKWGVLNDAP